MLLRGYNPRYFFTHSSRVVTLPDMVGRPTRERQRHYEAGRLLGSEVQRRRRALRLARRELAAAAGISPTTLARIEQQRTTDPGVFTVQALAVALGARIDDLLDTDRPSSAINAH